ncbi:MAG: glycosyltransferase [Promicromonosporaceae bacterium]|nr:glycosyltransferase [Promicromonosporaceae bacterium]
MTPSTAESETVSRSRRVTIVSRIYRPEPAAAAFRLGAAVDALLGAGNEVDVLTVRAPRSLAKRAAADDAASGARVHRWPVFRDANEYVRGYLSYLSFDVPLVLRLAVTRRPGVFVVEPPPTTSAMVRLIAAMRRTPYVAYLPDLWADGTEATGASRLVVRAVGILERFGLRGAAAVIASTDRIAARAAELHGIDATRVHVVRNGIDTSVFTKDGSTAPEAPSGPYAIYAGTISEWQGAEILVEAWAAVIGRVPNATLVFLGQGTGVESLERIAMRLPNGGASVRILPLVPAEQAATWQRGAAVALCSMRPATGYDYFLPTKVFAAAACGTPVLYVGPGPAGELVKSEQLGLAVPFDVHEVGEALVGMLEAPPVDAERSRLAAWAKANASIVNAGQGAAAIIKRACRR